MNKIEKIWWSIYYSIKDTKFKIKMEYQRIRYGWSDEMIWGLDDYLADTISRLTFALSETNTGYPNGLTEKKWNQILKDISFGFASYREMSSGFYPEKCAEYKQLQKDYDKGMKLFVKYFPYLWD